MKDRQLRQTLMSNIPHLVTSYITTRCLLALVIVPLYQLFFSKKSVADHAGDELSMEEELVKIF